MTRIRQLYNCQLNSNVEKEKKTKLGHMSAYMYSYKNGGSEQKKRAHSHKQSHHKMSTVEKHRNGVLCGVSGVELVGKKK